MAELNFKSACELTALIRKRKLKPSEVVAHALARVEALNGKLNAFCAMRAEQAMAETGARIGVGLHDARRVEVYLEIAGSVQLEPCVLPFAAAIERLAELNVPFALAGTAAERAHQHLPASLLSNVRQPDALWVAKLARTVTPAHEPPRPLYLRPPDAKLPVQR